MTCPCPCHKPGHSMKHAQPCCGDAGVTRASQTLEAVVRAAGELRQKLDVASGNYGKGMAEYERGDISGHALGVLKRRLNAAESAWREVAYRAEAIRLREEPQDDCPICGIVDGDCECPDEDRNAVLWPSARAALSKATGEGASA